MAVNDPVVARGTVFGELIDAAGKGPSLVGWAVEPDDLDAAIRCVGVTAVRGQRTRPDGSLLSWTMAGAGAALPRGLPFFLRWDTPASNPARSPAPHRAGVAPTGIAWIEVAASAEELDGWLGPHAGLDVRPVAASAPRQAAVAVALAGAAAEIVIPVFR